VLLITQRYALLPFCDTVGLPTVKVAEVTPLYGLLLLKLTKELPFQFCHWYDIPVATAPTVNDALLPLHITLLTGCDVIAGRVFTVSVAAVEVTDGAHMPDTTQRYW
jgi:hypothetical protein